MQKIRSLFDFKVLILVAIAGLVYLLFIARFGYFNDDWYLMYAAGAKGAAVFKDIFIIDRPMRALVMAPAYLLFGNNPILYNISAWGFRVLSALFFFKFLSAIWPHKKNIAWMSALLYLIYPGFLSQFNGIDYQSQMVSLAVMMLTLILTVHAYRAQKTSFRIFLFIPLIILTTLYLGLVEYFVGIEALKIACLLLLIFRDETQWIERIKKSVLWSAYSLFTALPFLFWRLFFFESERGATDVNMKFGDVLSDPTGSLWKWILNLLNDMNDVTFMAWIEPLRRMSYGITAHSWGIGIFITALVLLLAWRGFKSSEDFQNTQTKFDWRIESAWLGMVMLVAGLLPVILVGRYIDFKSFSRYALAPSIGVVLLWQAALAFIPSRIRNIFFALLIASSSLTHYANALTRARETEEMQNFWWQVSWRAPNIAQGTTLVANYSSVVIEEDYFVWGPANLIYYPESIHADYPQPGIYAVVITEDTINNIIARKPQEFSNRRGIRTYPNYRNILVITQPGADSCAQVISGKQVEYSSVEDPRILRIGEYSKAERISASESFHQPPLIPFGKEPAHGWCFFYEKAALARQSQNWNEVIRQGNEARAAGYSAKDKIEWMPFLEAYARAENTQRVDEIAALLDTNEKTQACQILNSTELSPAMLIEINKLFCGKN